MIGQKIGSYEITARLGEGGMGEVYRARDTRLDRDVALKVLPDPFASDPERLARFEREAKVLAGLNHANIGAIYGLEESQGKRFLVLELVEGENLAGRLARGPVPADETVDIALQIATALETAHEQGVVHRDLKPANIQLTPEGHVKVLDFGLAKALDTGGSDSSVNLSHSPTVAMSSPTVAGVILGTAAYMSPEQARGKAVDKRADVFAFGAVLYEMLTGRQLFAGDTVSDILAAVIRYTPDLDDLPDKTPEPLRRLLARCLEKDVRRRLRDIGEARVLLEDVRSGAAVEKTGPAAGAPARPGWLRLYGGWIAAAIVAVAAVMVSMTRSPDTTEQPAEKQVRKYTVPMANDDPSTLEAFDPVLSPDGRYLAYVSYNRLWIRDLSEIDPQPVADTEGANQPFWSPDGGWIGFGVGNKVYRVRRDGGRPALVTTLTTGFQLSDPGDAAWMEDGRVIMGTATSGLIEFPAQGGDASMLLEPGEDETDFHHAVRLPGDRGLLIVVHTSTGIGNLDVVLPDLSRKPVVRVEETISSPTYSPSGHVLFRRTGSSAGIWAVRFSLDNLEPVGEPFLVVAGGREPSVSADGTLCYVSNVTTREAQLVWLDRQGNVTGTIGNPTTTTRPFPDLSPDDKSLITPATFGDGRELFLYDLESGNSRRVTFNEYDEEVARWLPDGSGVVYYDSEQYDVYLLPLDATRDPVNLFSGIMAFPTADGSELVYAEAKPGQWDWDVFVRPFDSQPGDEKVLVSSDGQDWWPSLSPDGSLLLYMSDETGRDEIYVYSYPDLSTRWQVSTEGGSWPKWRQDGKEIFFTTRNQLWSVELTRNGSVTFGAPTVLFERPSIDWFSRWPDGFAVTSDGQRFVMWKHVTPDSEDTPAIVIVQNWQEEFAQ